MRLLVKRYIFQRRTIKYFLIALSCCILLYFALPKTPLVSVIIPTYNRADFIEKAIQSVLNQTYSNFEIIVIDDGSTDNSAQIIKKLAEKDHRIRYYKLEVNSGVSIARNKGLSLARGKYIAFLDSDDIALAHWLKTGVYFMEQNPHVAVGFTNTKFYQITDNKMHSFFYFLPLYLMTWSSQPHVGSIVRTNFIKRNHIQFNPHYISAEDWDFYIQIIMAGGRIERILPAVTLALVRYHTSNPSYYYHAGDTNSHKIREKIHHKLGFDSVLTDKCKMFKSFITVFPNAFNQFTQKIGLMYTCKQTRPGALFFKHPHWNDYILVDWENNRLCRTIKYTECAFIRESEENYFRITWETAESNETFVRVGQTNTFVFQENP